MNKILRIANIIIINFLLFASLIILGEMILRLFPYEKSSARWRVDASFSYYDMFAMKTRKSTDMNFVNAYHVTTKRVTPTNPPDGIKVFMFGGSTTAGGKKDSETIAAHLARISKENNTPMVVSNFGVNSFRSTEEIMKLIKILRAGGSPDIVVFYDGFNDTEFASRRQVRYDMLQPMEALFERRVTYGDVEKYLQTFELFKRMSGLPNIRSFLVAACWRLAGQRASNQDADIVDDLVLNDFEQARAYCVDTYSQNMGIVEKLAELYRFRPLFILQPMIYFKVGLTDAEKRVYESLSEKQKSEIPLLYEDISRAMESNMNFYRITDVFDNTDQTIFYMDQGHTHSFGREIVARRIYEILYDSVLRKTDTQMTKSIPYSKHSDLP